MDLRDITGQPIPAHFRSIIELVAERLSGLPQVLSTWVCGSVARGWADDYADLDINVVCEAIPPEPTRREAYAGFGPPLALGTMGVTEHRMRCDEFDIHQETGRTMVFLEFETHNSVSQWVERVINMENASEDDCHRASALQDSLIVSDIGGVLSYLRDRIHPMPDPVRRFLVAKSVERMTEGYRIECAKKAALRGDIFASRQHLLDLIKSTAHVCLSFNGKYYPGGKNLQGHLSNCSVLPDQFIRRLIEVLSNPDPIYAFQQWFNLAQEVMELVADCVSDEQRGIAFQDLQWIGNWDWHP